jgi:hypothetical protein
VLSRKSQAQFRHVGFLYLGFDLGCTILRKIPAEHSGYIKKRAAPADQTYIMGTVADNVTLSAQDGIL